MQVPNLKKISHYLMVRKRGKISEEDIDQLLTYIAFLQEQVTLKDRALAESIDFVYTVMGGQGGAEILHLEAALQGHLKDMGLIEQVS